MMVQPQLQYCHANRLPSVRQLFYILKKKNENSLYQRIGIDQRKKLPMMCRNLCIPVMLNEFLHFSHSQTFDTISFAISMLQSVSLTLKIMESQETFPAKFDIFIHLPTVANVFGNKNSTFDQIYRTLVVLCEWIYVV